MAHLKVPVALWQDTNGNWTACAIDGASVSAIGSDAKDAKQQLCLLYTSDAADE